MIFRMLDALRVFDVFYILTSNSNDTLPMAGYARRAARGTTRWWTLSSRKWTRTRRSPPESSWAGIRWLVAPALRRKAALGLLNQRHNIRHIPKPIGNASGHGRGDAQRLMDADEVVIGHVQRDRVQVMLDLL